MNTTKTLPVIRIEKPNAGSIPATIEQLHGLGFTSAEIEAGEKRLEIKQRGPWGMIHSCSGVVEKSEFDPESYSSARKWIEFYPVRTLFNVRQSGYELEGRISVGGVKTSAFTSSILFELPDGLLIDCGVIFARK